MSQASFASLSDGPQIRSRGAARAEHNPQVMSAEGSLGSLLDVQDARLVVIHDAWTGYNHHSPIAEVWELRRVASGRLGGEGRLSTALVDEADEQVVDVTISATRTKKFFDSIAGAHVVPGPYEPLMEHTDDFPHIEIAFHVGVRSMTRPGGIALLFTASQGKFHAARGAFVGGQVLTIPGGGGWSGSRGPGCTAETEHARPDDEGGRQGRRVGDGVHDVRVAPDERRVKFQRQPGHRVAHEADPLR